MVNFIVYKYSFPEPQQEDVLKEAYKTAEELNAGLATMLKDVCNKGGELNLQCTTNKEDGTVEKYANVPSTCAKGVFLFIVHSKRSTSITPEDAIEKVSIPTYPVCWVVIDTRPNSQLILIQKKTDAFGKNTDFVADILLGECVNRGLDLTMNGTSLHLEKRICDGNLWDVVKQRVSNNNDKLNALHIKCKNRVVDEEPEKSDEIDRAFQLILRQMNSDEGELKVLTSTDKESIMKEIKPDVIGIAETLLKYNYSIRADFEKSGSFACGKNTEAIYGAKDEIVKKFGVVPQPNTDGPNPFELIEWLDNIILTDKSYYYTDKLGNYGRHKPKRKASA